MYPRNAASPEPIAIGPVILIADGTVQTSGVTVRIKPIGVAEGDGAGTTAYSTDGIILYTPTQAETNYTSFVLIAKKASCIPASITIITTASATPGTVLLAPVTHTSAVVPTVSAVTGAVGSVTGAVGSVTGAVGSVVGSVGSVTGNVGGSVGSVVGAVGSVTAGVVVTTNSDKSGYSLTATTGLGNQTANITGNLSGSVGSVTGNVGGNVVGSVASVSGAVGSVTGAVGSVAGNVGGNVVGTVASVVGAVGSVAAAVTVTGDLSATMKASVNTEVDTALADIHLDHLLATDYDPASKPGTATALLNELIESDAGVSRYTANALEQAPSGTGASASAIADEVQTRTIAAVTTVGTTTNLTNLPAIPANWLTAAGIAANALDGKGNWNVGKTGYALTQAFPANFAALGINASGHVSRVTLADTTTTNTDMRGTDGANTTAPPTAASIADAVWDEILSGHAIVGSTGAALSAAGGSGDPWSTALPGAYGAGTAGYTVGTFIDAAISGVSGTGGDATAANQAAIIAALQGPAGVQY